MSVVDGMIDFEKLIPVLPDGIPVVWELSSRIPKEQISETLSQWKEKFPEA